MANYHTNYAGAAYKRRPKSFSQMSGFEKFCFISLLVFWSLVALFVIFFAIKEAPETLPTVTDVVIIEEKPLSFEEFSEGVLHAKSNSDTLDLSFSEIEYKFKIKFADGGEIIASSHEGDIYLDEKTVIRVDVTASAEECLKSYEEGKALKINIAVKQKNRHSGRGYSLRYTVIYEEASTMDIVSSYVKSIQPLTNEVITVYSRSEEINLDGVPFEITYSDGRKVNATVKSEKKVPCKFIQTLDGKKLNVYGLTEDEKEITVGFADSDCTLRCELKEYPFEKAEITDCTFDDGYNITSVSYKVMMKDGTVKEYVSEPYGYYDAYSKYTADIIYGYNIFADRDFIYPENSEKAKLQVSLMFGFLEDEPLEITAEFDAPESECDCICHNNGKSTKKFYEKIKGVAEFFEIKEICRCGISHYVIPDTNYDLFL